MSLYTQWEEIANNINDAVWWTDRIINHKPIYTELEYIQSSGSQYINTGLTINPNITYNFDFALTKKGNDLGIIGARSGDSTYRHSLMQYSGGFHFMFGSNSTWNASTDYNRHKFIMKYISNNKYALTVDGRSLGTISSNIGTNSSVPYYIFRNGQNNPSSMRLYSAQFYRSGVLVRDYIPAKNKNGVVCLYDKLNKNYTYNVGSGSFIARTRVIRKENNMASYSSYENVLLAGQVAYFRKSGSMLNRGTIEIPNALTSHSYGEGYIGPNSVVHGTDLADTSEYKTCETYMKAYLEDHWDEVAEERTIITNCNIINNMLLPGEINMQNLVNSIS